MRQGCVTNHIQKKRTRYMYGKRIFVVRFLIKTTDHIHLVFVPVHMGSVRLPCFRSKVGIVYVLFQELKK